MKYKIITSVSTATVWLFFWTNEMSSLLEQMYKKDIKQNTKTIQKFKS